MPREPFPSPCFPGPCGALAFSPLLGAVFHIHHPSHFSAKPGIKNVASADKNQETSALKLAFCLCCWLPGDLRRTLNYG